MLYLLGIMCPCDERCTTLGLHNYTTKSAVHVIPGSSPGKPLFRIRSQKVSLRGFMHLYLSSQQRDLTTHPQVRTSINYAVQLNGKFTMTSLFPIDVYVPYMVAAENGVPPASGQ